MKRVFINSKHIMTIAFCFMNIFLLSASAYSTQETDSTTYYQDSTFIGSDSTHLIISAATNSNSGEYARTIFNKNLQILRSFYSFNDLMAGRRGWYEWVYEYDSNENLKNVTAYKIQVIGKDSTNTTTVKKYDIEESAKKIDTIITNNGLFKTIKYYSDINHSPDSLVRTEFYEYNNTSDNKLLITKNIEQISYNELLGKTAQSIRQKYIYDSLSNLKTIKVRWTTDNYKGNHLTNPDGKTLYVKQQKSGQYIIDYDINYTSESTATINQVRKQNIHIANIKMQKNVFMNAFNLRGQMIPSSRSLSGQTGNMRINNTAGITILHTRGQNGIMPVKHISVR